MAFFNPRDHFFRGINPTVIISFMPMALLLRKPGNFFFRINPTVIISFLPKALLRESFKIISS